MHQNIATAYANANIALIKYWGKNDSPFNIPAVSSISMTLDKLGTTVSLSFLKSTNHAVFIDDNIASAEITQRVVIYLEEIRKLYPYSGFFKVSSSSNIPLGAGLASSSSFYAALALTLNDILQLRLNQQDLSLLARIGSASAARSIFGGASALNGGLDLPHNEAFAFPIAMHKELNLVMVIALVDRRPKAISSRQAMNNTKATSPFFASFVNAQATDFSEALKALSDGNLAILGSSMEHSTLKMFATMWSARPAINYWQPQSLALIDLVYRLREQHGPKVFFTMDAGPNVKIICENHFLSVVIEKISTSGIDVEVLCSLPGQAAHIVDLSS
jgi:diphosphomevalonate decarboxylase